MFIQKDSYDAVTNRTSLFNKILRPTMKKAIQQNKNHIHNDRFYYQTITNVLALDVFKLQFNLKKHWKKFPPQTPKEKIRCNFNNITEFSETKKTISQAGIQFHTFVLPNEKQLSLLLKGLSQIETNYYR